MNAESEQRNALAALCLSIFMNQKELRDSAVKLALAIYAMVRCMATGIRFDDNEATAQTAALMALAEFKNPSACAGRYVGETALEALEWLQHKTDTALTLAMFSVDDMPHDLRGVTASRTALSLAMAQRLLSFAAQHPERLGTYLDVAREEMHNTPKDGARARLATLQDDVLRIGNERIRAALNNQPDRVDV